MPHHTPLIATIVVGLVVAFAMGALAHRLRLPSIAGYLLAGVIVGPFTPGYVADSNIANELAELGVILLMFGVGLHFSMRDLLAVRNIAIPGAVVQILAATLMGMTLSWALGWSLLAGIVFGLALSVASTVVLLRALQGRNLVDTERGRIAVGWLIVEDLAMVLALVLLPALAGTLDQPDGIGFEAVAAPLAETFFKVIGFIAFMLIVGRRVIPRALLWVVHTGSRELFRLAVLAIALGVAFGAALAFNVSFALGAFFAGVILGETPLSRRATEETLPLRDAFAVLFFVSVGMLFNPMTVLKQPLPLLATVGIIVIGKSLAAYLIVRAFGRSKQTSITVAASLAQIGEFSFILATLGTGLGILPPEGRDLILAGAIISIFLNPFAFSFVPPRQEEPPPAEAEPQPKAVPSGHVILVGYGSLGRRLARELQDRKRELIVVEEQPDMAKEAENDGFEVIRGNAIDNATLEAARIGSASKVLLLLPEGYEAGAIYEHARALKPGIPVIARAHSEGEYQHLTQLGMTDVVLGEAEIASRMLAMATAARAAA